MQHWVDHISGLHIWEGGWWVWNEWPESDRTEQTNDMITMLLHCNNATRNVGMLKWKIKNVTDQFQYYQVGHLRFEHTHNTATIYMRLTIWKRCKSAKQLQ